MPYEEEIDNRVREIVAVWGDVTHKKMFGGVCHLLSGNMVCGVYKEFLILRLGAENAANALNLPFVKPFDITGRPMKGWVMVEKDGFATEEALQDWLNQAREFVLTLPPK